MSTDQLSLPGLQAHLDLAQVKTRARLGHLGEELAYQSLKLAGYEVTPCRLGEIGDLRVKDTATGQLFRVEVKTARQAIDKKWRFTLYKDSKRSKQNHRQADIVLLLAVDQGGYVIPFIVPIKIVKDQNQACITSDPTTYKGKLAPYRQELQALHL